MEELVEQLEGQAASQGLNVDTCIRFVWAGAPDWAKVVRTLAAVREGKTAEVRCANIT